jgi:hypothetical protein
MRHYGQAATDRQPFVSRSGSTRFLARSNRAHHPVAAKGPLPCDRSQRWRRVATTVNEILIARINRSKPAGYPRSGSPYHPAAAGFPRRLTFSLNICSIMVYTDDVLRRSRHGVRGGARMAIDQQTAAYAHRPVRRRARRILANGCECLQMLVRMLVKLLAGCMP